MIWSRFARAPLVSRGLAQRSFFLRRKFSTDIFKTISSRDVKGLRQLTEDGIDINALDSDNKSPLHHAAQLGDVTIVQYLIQKGAHVNAVDKDGATPLSEACKNRHSQVSAIIRLAGGKLTVSPNEAGAALCQAAAMGDLPYLETLLKTPNYDVNSRDFEKRTPLHVACSTGQMETVKFLISRGADVNALDRWNNNPWVDARRSGFDEICSLLVKLGSKTSAVATVSAGDKPTITTGKGSSQEVLDLTFEALVSKGTYNTHLLASETDWYFNVLDFHNYYFKRFSPAEIAQHIESYIAAKKLAESGDRPQDLYINHESKNHCLHICPFNINSQIEVERALEKHILDHPDDGFSIVHMKSKGVAVPTASSSLAMYVLDRQAYNSVPKGELKDFDLKDVSTKTFLTGKSQDVYLRYEEIVKTASSHLSPTMKIFPPHHDGSIPVMLAFRRESMASSLSQMTELFRTHQLNCERKMVETFSNGIVVYSFYFSADSDPSQIQEFLEQVGNLFLVPRSNILMKLYLSGEFTAKEYAYSVALKKFAYYFMAQDNDDLKSLMNEFKADPVKRQKLLAIRRLMRHEVVTEDGIATVIAKYPDFMSQLYLDFEATTSPDSAKPPKFNEELAAVARQVAVSAEDLQLLTTFLTFNAAIRKTNFHKYPKSSISYRFDPSFIKALDLDVPFALFMVMSNDFQGFHIRFGDIARGGIRAIKSDNSVIHSRNKESLFMENFNLAHTQMRKNKDIPETGSKGTVFLNPGMTTHKNVEIAFRKYVSGMLDLLLLPHDQIVDHYGKPEILFFGPDENTADLMEWAALYSKGRGYKFWKAFTTGKPPSLGGIPHDTYGMTTRSVHEYVVQTLAKVGVDESSVTKLQTGGPDGDLGSNEILISKDKTLAVVDVTGVLYDPNGLNRAELERLAHARLTVKFFDQSKLSSGGFLVLQDEKGRKLPTGEIVDGRVFRDEFHLSPLSSADLFVPCGGRPEAVNAKNVHRMFHPDGKTPRFKYIIEGANLFITQDARLVLEQAGVILFKDASANKGGVTSSSLEVLAALTLTDAEAETHMSASNKDNAPEFYKKYVTEVQRRVQENARLEFECIWAEAERTGTSRVVLTDILSDKINSMNASISKSDLYTRVELRNKVLSNAVPQLLLDLVGGLDVVLQRVPENYMHAIFNKHLASRFIYTHGINADQIAFYQFMEDYSNGKFSR